MSLIQIAVSVKQLSAATVSAVYIFFMVCDGARMVGLGSEQLALAPTPLLIRRRAGCASLAAR